MTRAATDWRLSWSLQVTALAIAFSGVAQAQYRPNQEPVLTPLPARPILPPPDVVAPFQSAYHAAGEPRIMLFWNVAFDDETQTQHQRVEVIQKSGTNSSTGLDKKTQGPAGDSTLNESDGKSQERIEQTSSDKNVDPAKYITHLSARNAVQLEVAFRQTLETAGVHLVSRATGMRMTQVDQDRTGVDPKLIEADAVAHHADLLLEIVMVQDAAAPLGAGFKISVTDVHSATEIITDYSEARVRPQPLPSRYVVTDTGFERRTASRPPATKSCKS